MDKPKVLKVSNKRDKMHLPVSGEFAVRPIRYDSYYEENDSSINPSK